MEKVLSKILNKVLGSFIDNLDSEQLDVSLIRGKIELKNLALKKDFLYLLGLPFEMKYGIIKHVTVKISWRKLNTKSVRITMKEVYAYLTPKNPTEWDEEQERENLKKAKKMHLNKFEAMQVQETEDEEQETGYFKKKIIKIFNNLELQIEDLYVRYEHCLIDQPSFTAGVYLRLMEVNTCNGNWEKQFGSDPDLLFKFMRIDDFSIFIDYECQHRLRDFSESSVDIAFDFLAEKEKNRELEHNFLLTPSFLEAKLIKNIKGKNKKLPLMKAELNISKSSLEFYTKHAGLLMSVVKLLKLHSNFTAGVRQELKEGCFPDDVCEKYKETYRKWMVFVMKEKKKEAEKIANELNELESGVLVCEIEAQRSEAILEYRISIATTKIQKLEAKKKGKSISKIFSDSDKINLEIQQKINSLKADIADLQSGKNAEAHCAELAKLEVTVTFLSPNCKIYENKDSELLNIGVKKLYLNVRIGGVNPSFTFNINRCLITDLYEKSEIFPNLLELQSFRLEASTNPLTLSISCTKAFIYLIFSTIFKTFTSIKSSIQNLKIEVGHNTFKERYEVYVSLGKHFLRENAERMNKTKAFFDVNLDIEAPIIFVPSGYSEKRSILCLDFGKITAQSSSSIQDPGVLVDHFPFQLTDFSVYTIWSWDSLRSSTNISKNSILSPIQASLEITKPKPNDLNVNETTLKLKTSSIEFTINAMSLQSFEDILTLMNKFIPEKKVKNKRYVKELAVRQRIVTSFSVPKTNPVSIDFSFEKFVISFQEMRPIAKFVLDDIKLVGIIDCFRVMKVKLTVFEIYLKDERAEAVITDIIINPAISLITHIRKTLQKYQLTVDILKDPNRSVMDLGVNMNELKFYLNLNLINALIKTFMFNKEALLFLGKLKQGEKEVAADYSKKKKAFARFSAIFQQLELVIPTQRDEKKIKAYVSAALTFTFESQKTLFLLLSAENKVLKQSIIAQEKEFTLIMSHLTTSIKTSDSFYNVLQPCRFMIECKIFSDLFKKSINRVATVRMESIVLFFGSKLLQFLKNFYSDLKTFKSKYKSVKKETITEEYEKNLQADIDIDAFQVFILNDKSAEIQSLIAHKCSYLTFLLVKQNETFALSGDIIMNTEYYNSLLACWEPVVEDSKLSLSVNSTNEKVEFGFELPQIFNINITKGLITNLASLNSTMALNSEPRTKANNKTKVKVIKSFEYVIQNCLNIAFSVWLTLEKDPINTYLPPNQSKRFSNEYVQKLSTLMNKKAKSTSVMNSVQMPTVINFSFESEIYNINVDNLGFSCVKAVSEGLEYEILVYVYSEVGNRFVVFDSMYKVANNTQYEIEVLWKEQKFVCMAKSLFSIPLTWTKNLQEIKLNIENKEFGFEEREIEVDSNIFVHQISLFKIGKDFMRISEISCKYYMQNLLFSQIEICTEDQHTVQTIFVDVGEEIELNLKESQSFSIKIHEKDSISQSDSCVLSEFSNEIIAIPQSGMSFRLATSEKLFSEYSLFTETFGKILLNLSTLDKDPKSEFYPQRITVFSDYIIVNKSQYDLQISELSLKAASLSYFSTDSKKTKIRLLETPSKWSDSFRIDTIGVAGALEVIKTSDEPQPLSFGLLIANAPNPLKNTILVNISPRFVLWNQLEFDIYVAQGGKEHDAVILKGGTSERGSFMPFEYSFVEKTKVVKVSLDKIQWSGPFSIETLNDIQVKLKSDQMDTEKTLSFFQKNWFAPKEDLQFRFIRILITTADEACIHIVLMNPKDPDFRIVNKTTQEIYYKQSGLKSEKFLLKSGDSVPWAWDSHTVSKKKVEIYYEDCCKAFSIEKIEYQNNENPKENNRENQEITKKKFKDCFVYVEIKDSTRELVIIHPSFGEIDEGNEMKREDSIDMGLFGGIVTNGFKVAGRIFSFKIKASEMGVSLFDSENRENFYLFFQDLNIKLAIKNLNLACKREKNLKLKMKLRHFQIDSSDPDPNLFTVILAPMFLIEDKKTDQSKNHYFFMLELEVTDTLKKNTQGDFVPIMKIIENFDLVLQKIQAKINEETLLKLLHLTTLFKLLKPSKPTSLQNSPSLSTSIPALPYQKSSSLQKFYFHFIKLGVLQLSLTFQRSDKPKNPQESKELFQVLRAIGGAFTNISNASLSFKEILIVNSFQNKQNFAMVLVKNYIRQGITQAYKLFGSIDIIGNPLELINTLGTGVYEFMTEPAKGLIGGPKAFAIGLGKGVKSLVTSIIKGSFESAAKITGGLYNVLKSATGEKTSAPSLSPENIGKNMLVGLKEASTDIYTGISGIFTKPYKGAKSKGAKGLFIGLLSGTAGLLTSPLKLVLKLSSVLSSGIASTATLLSQGKIQKYGRARFPRHWGSKLAIEPYNEVFAEAQAFLVSFQEMRNERVLYFTEINLKASEVVVKDFQIFLIVTGNWVLFVVDGVLEGKVRVLELKVLEVHEFRGIFVMGVVGKGVKWVVPSEEFASLAGVWNRLAEFGGKESGERFEYPRMLYGPKGN